MKLGLSEQGMVDVFVRQATEARDEMRTWNADDRQDWNKVLLSEFSHLVRAIVEVVSTNNQRIEDELTRLGVLPKE